MLSVSVALMALVALLAAVAL